MSRIDLLLTQSPNRVPKRLGDIGALAPYVHFLCAEESAILPMPTNVTSGNQILWEQKDFTPDSIGGAAAISAYKKSGETGALEALGSGGAGVIAGRAKDAASSVGSSVLGASDLGDYVLHKQNKAVNPNKEMTFNGIGYRSFQFEFELIPLNQKEAAAIKQFIEFFQTQAMPDFAGEGSTYFAYPSAWDIKFGNAEWLPKILPAYLTDYSVNYGGVGKMVAHKDSAVQTNIQLTFTESQLHTKAKVKEGYVG